MSTLSKEDVTTVIFRALGPNFQILDYHLEPFSPHKHGIFGNHQLLSVKVQEDNSANDNGARVETFFFKTEPDSSIIRDDLMDESIFLEEVHFYEKISPHMTFEPKSKQWLPRCYLVKPSGLVFEDLRSQGYNVRQDVPMDDIDFLKSALSSLAYFHAASITLEARLGKSLLDVYPGWFAEKMYVRGNKFGKWTSHGFDTLPLLAQRFGLNSNQVPKMYEYAHKAVKYQPGRCNVLCHSDLWKNNLLIKGSGASTSCIIVDFQMLRYASPACDIGMLLYLNSSPAFRKKFEFEMFAYYYTILKDAIMRQGGKILVPNYKDLLMDYKTRRLVGMIYAIQYLPGIYLKPETFKKVGNDPSLLKKWFFIDRFSFIKEAMDEDSIYESRIRDILVELFEESARLFGD